MNPFGGNVGWDDKIVIRKKYQGTTKRAPSGSTDNVMTIEKKQKPLNKPSSAQIDHRHAAKVDRETDDFHIKRVPLEVSRLIQKARADKGLSQKDLAMKISESASAVANYEQGKAIPNQQILAKMERELGVKLRGKDIGTPIAPKPAKVKKETETAGAAASNAAGPSTAKLKAGAKK